MTIDLFSALIGAAFVAIGCLLGLALYRDGRQDEADAFNAEPPILQLTKGTFKPEIPTEVVK